MINGAMGVELTRRVTRARSVVQFNTSHHSNAGHLLRISKNRTLNPILANVIGSNVVYSASNNITTVDLHVLLLALTGATVVYIGYDNPAASVAKLTVVGHVGGACDNMADIFGANMLIGDALLGCPALSANGESVMHINNASLGGKAGVVQIGSNGVTTRIHGARCKDSVGTERLVVTDVGLSSVGMLTHTGDGDFSGNIVCTTVKTGNTRLQANGLSTTNNSALSFNGADTETTGTMHATKVKAGNVQLQNNGLQIAGNTPLSFNGADTETTGTMYATSFVALSDKRYKKNISPMPPVECFNIMSRLAAYTYELNHRPGIKRSGFLAQDVIQVAPHLVHVVNVDGRRVYTVNYGDLAACVVGALNELWFRLKLLAACMLLALVLLSLHRAR